jgi:hypothetical protein
VARIAIDLAHAQRGWNGYYPSLLNQCRVLTAHTFETIEADKTLDAATLAPYDALILALPCNVELRAPEIDAVRAWVTENRKGLFLLSYYSGDSHHRTNLNQLARPLGVEFDEDLIMPHDRITNADAQAQVTNRGDDGKYVVRVSPPGGALGAHPIAQNIRALGFLSACSLKLSNVSLQFLLTSPQDSARLEPYLPLRGPGGWIMKTDWARSGYASVPLFAAWQADLGKVAASGTWKLWLPELLATQKVENAQLFENVVEWLVN